MQNSNSKVAKVIAAAGIFILCGAFAGIALVAREKSTPDHSADPAAAPESKTNFPVHIRKPVGPPLLPTGLTNFHGESVKVTCATCHTTTTPNRALRSSAELDQFHQELKFQHGTLNCLSCHNEDNYDTLRLADGSVVEFENVMQLCAQCHGPQARDYKNGSHGGMNGFWDLTKGPRTRNNCIHCHNPHAPQYATVMPVFQPVPAQRGQKSSNQSPGH